ncbi:hypothetical protein CNMCM6106_008192 [Aspergillus hiratsukae]|uniref:Uncharacterized protein n=1 Tax=Aspergillus hiratsukae TaxID=1194566 RepID=A0A8H6V0I4_9EURO|nr:hypothetical protein CNMCM6106_008192 [Aspergillus hiratsukae]
MTLLIILFGLLLGGIFALDEVTSSPLNNYVASQAGTWGQSPSYAPTPGDFGRERTPSEYSLSPTHQFGERSTPLPQSQPGRLRFLDDLESDNGATDDEQPTCMPYVIEWRVTLNNRVLAKDTEQDLVSRPSSYWRQIKQKAERVLRQKINRNRRVKPDDTSVVVSVNDRSQRDLTKHFEKTDIDWTAINRQMFMWQNLLPPRREELTKEEAPQQPTGCFVNGMIELMLKIPLDTLQFGEMYIRKCDALDRPATMRGTLVKYVQQGGIIETHDDIPDNVREQLYAEERQRLSKQNKSTNGSAGSMPPQININVLPAQSSQPSISSSWGTEAKPSTVQSELVDIPGLLDQAVEEYADWHLSRVSAEGFKANIKKARDISLDNCLDLKQICAENPDFFVKQGVKIGAARRFRQTAVAEERAAQFDQFYSRFPSTEVDPIITPSIAPPSTVADPFIAHLTGPGEPSVTHELEELLPPLSPAPAPIELEDDHLHIDELPLPLGRFEAAASPEPETPVLRAPRTGSERRRVVNQSNIEIRVPRPPIIGPGEDICTLARALADQLYQHHGCCHQCHEQAHRIHTALADYLDHINTDGDFPDVLSSTTIATRESNLAQRVTKERKQQVFCGIGPGQPDQLPTHLCLAADHRPGPTLGVTLDIDSVGGFVSSLAVARRGIRWYPTQMPVSDLQSGLHVNPISVQYLDPNGQAHTVRRPVHQVPHCTFGRLIGNPAVC